MLSLRFRKYAKGLPRPVKSTLLSAFYATRDVPGRLLDKLGRPRSAWRTRLSSEIAFWDDYLSTGGRSWPEDFQRRTTMDWPFQEFLARLIPAEEQSPEIEILDVGAGPLTQLGTSWPGRNLHVTAVDPLADEYEALLKKYRIVPPVLTARCDAERLAEHFGESRFHLVYARNCLDHSYDPLLAIRQAVAVVKPGCRVYLQHEQNEALKEAGRGLHKWNFRAVGGEFIIERAGHAVNVTSETSDSAELSCSVDADDNLIVLLRKRAERST
jgi:SAM-dependent methyltransferase